MKINQCSLDSSVGSWWPCASQAYSMDDDWERKRRVNEKVAVCRVGEDSE